MNLYVWEGVLEDYTSGLVCCLAESEEEAWKLLYETDTSAWWVLQGRPQIKGKGDSQIAFAALKSQGLFKFETATSPECVTKPSCFLVWGGG